jgi:hypothetical protein
MIMWIQPALILSTPSLWFRPSPVFNYSLLLSWMDSNPARDKSFCRLQTVRISCGAHPASCTVVFIYYQPRNAVKLSQIHNSILKKHTTLLHVSDLTGPSSGRTSVVAYINNVWSSCTCRRTAGNFPRSELLHSRLERRMDGLGVFPLQLDRTLTSNCFMQRLMYVLMMDQ